MFVKKLFGIVMAAMCCIMASADSGVSITISQKDSGKDQTTVVHEEQNQAEKPQIASKSIRQRILALEQDAPSILKLAVGISVLLFYIDGNYKLSGSLGTILRGGWNLDRSMALRGAENALKNMARMVGAKIAGEGVLAAAGALERML